VHITTDGGKNWANVTPKAMPEWGTVSMIEASMYNAGTAYVSVQRHKMDDFAPYAFKTTDFGKTWTSITNGIPADAFIHAVREDRERKGLLYAGTERGVFFSWDDGATWQSIQGNLPVSPVYDLTVHGNDLLAATHGRAFWALDDLSPLQQYKPEVANEEVHLYAPRAAPPRPRQRKLKRPQRKARSRGRPIRPTRRSRQNPKPQPAKVVRAQRMLPSHWRFSTRKARSCASIRLSSNRGPTQATMKALDLARQTVDYPQKLG
jgi:hypothetical protein